MAQEAARADRQARDQRGPFLVGQLRAIQRGPGDGGMRFAEPAHEFGVAEAPAVLADDARAFMGRDHFGERDQPQIRRRLERRITALRPLAKQIEQLPELRLRRALARSAVAQHSGKAIVEMH